MATVTNDSVNSLGFAVKDEAYAIIKASWIILSKEKLKKLSARNILEAKVAAAANLVYPFKEMQAVFEKQNSGEKLIIVFGSSDKGYTQITNETPYDMFFSADMGYVEKLKKAGLAVTEPKPYAHGRIGLWVKSRKNCDSRPLLRPLWCSGSKCTQKPKLLRQSKREVCTWRKCIASGSICSKRSGRYRDTPHLFGLFGYS